MEWMQPSFFDLEAERLAIQSAMGDVNRDIGSPPRLWDVPPDMGIVHIAGAQMVMFGRYLRQRCDWCGVILLEYDLERVMVSGPDKRMPAMWPVQSLILVDGNMATEWEKVPVEGTTDIKLPMNACAFNPLTQVGL